MPHQALKIWKQHLVQNRVTVSPLALEQEGQRGQLPLRAPDTAGSAPAGPMPVPVREKAFYVYVLVTVSCSMSIECPNQIKSSKVKQLYAFDSPSF